MTSAATLAAARVMIKVIFQSRLATARAAAKELSDFLMAAAAPGFSFANACVAPSRMSVPALFDVVGAGSPQPLRYKPSLNRPAAAGKPPAGRFGLDPIARIVEECARRPGVLL